MNFHTEMYSKSSIFLKKSPNSTSNDADSKRRANEDFYRPSQHRLDRNTRKGHADGRFYCAIVPDKFKTVEGQLTCDQCDKCQIQFCEEWPSKQQAYAVANFKRHYARFHLDQPADGESQNETQNGGENPQGGPNNLQIPGGCDRPIQ